MNYNSIGKIAAAHGVNGELILKHALGKKTSLKGLETIFIEAHKGEFLPYFVHSSRMKTETEVYLQLEGVATREQAQKLVSKEVWLAEQDFQLYAAKTASISLLGFHIITDGKDLGEILEVIEQPHQVLCRIDLNGKEALIPVHQGSLVSMDQQKKQVVLDLPEGLLEIYA
ncbi:ribosome maturation factor RimM [Flavihumibacter stibioxidans]|uniref:Ribosome maturation factor RimM n=1 Tax=Flavihumibacter stibioxidans TaxID=1834163 RepID=A0ABR7M7H0_9BACT|nr:ribosome maturation factor RimM [Flavihumibacter stibioxidans]MBC6490479.1 16S rRNA processing protein RimM [Flavihumibacter stibioxidans]